MIPPIRKCSRIVKTSIRGCVSNAACGCRSLIRKRELHRITALCLWRDNNECLVFVTGKSTRTLQRGGGSPNGSIYCSIIITGPTATEKPKSRRQVSGPSLAVFKLCLHLGETNVLCVLCGNEQVTKCVMRSSACKCSGRQFPGISQWLMQREISTREKQTAPRGVTDSVYCPLSERNWSCLCDVLRSIPAHCDALKCFREGHFAQFLAFPPYLQFPMTKDGYVRQVFLRLLSVTL